MRMSVATGLLLVLLAGLPVAASEPEPQEALLRRLDALEAETQQLREQLRGLPENPPREASPPPSDPAAAPQLPGPQSAVAPAADPSQYFTLDELKGEMRKLAWTKGDFRIVPYGILWGNAVYETQRTQVGDYTFFVLPDRDRGEQFHADGRSTRFGVDVAGPQIRQLDCAVSGGKIEFDFQRNIDTENRSGVLLRHAYVEVKNDDFRLLLGQTWDVISPLYPGMLMYSIGWGGGNIGYRRGQLRGERYLELSDMAAVTLQGSLNADILSELNRTDFAGDQAGWPVLEGRIGTTLGPRGPGCYPIEFGVSSHIGEQLYDFRAPLPVVGLDVPRRTWSLNADWRIPFNSRFGLQGEFFTGENLGAYLGGILQGIDIGTPALTGTTEPIRSTGGWIDVWYDWTTRLHSHVGYGIDDPNNNDVTAGRNYNSFYFANISYDLAPKFLVGFEVSQWDTHWVNQPEGESTHFEFAAKYGF